MPEAGRLRPTPRSAPPGRRVLQRHGRRARSVTDGATRLKPPPGAWLWAACWGRCHVRTRVHLNTTTYATKRSGVAWSSSVASWTRCLSDRRRSVRRSDGGPVVVQPAVQPRRPDGGPHWTTPNTLRDCSAPFVSELLNRRHRFAGAMGRCDLTVLDRHPATCPAVEVGESTLRYYLLRTALRHATTVRGSSTVRPRLIVPPSGSEPRGRGRGGPADEPRRRSVRPRRR
jgi:hypothetical protein